MTKSSPSRENRHNRRELFSARETIRKNALKASTLAKRVSENIEKAKHTIEHFKSKTTLLNKDLQRLRSLCLAQQEVFKHQQETITLEKSRNKKAQHAMVECSATIRPLNEAYRKLNLAFLEQRDVIRNQQRLLKEPMDVARTMIALSNGLCSHCLDTRHVMVTKRNVRYSVECKACKNIVQ
tara:strand:+ start:670 stop:1215 length:546 start_codon:yes stop_codon:yes gene_type:complete